MVEVDLYRLFYKSLKIKSKFKLTAFLSNTMKTNYLSERVKSTSFGTKKTSPGQSYTNLRLLQRAKRWGHAEDAGCSCSFVTQSYSSVRKFGFCARTYVISDIAIHIFPFLLFC